VDSLTLIGEALRSFETSGTLTQRHCITSQKTRLLNKVGFWYVTKHFSIASKKNHYAKPKIKTGLISISMDLTVNLT